MTRLLCKDCDFCVITKDEAVDQAGHKTGLIILNGWCHLNPPDWTGPMQTTFRPVSVDPVAPATKNAWCAQGPPRITRKEKPNVHRKR